MSWPVPEVEPVRGGGTAAPADGHQLILLLRTSQQLVTVVIRAIVHLTPAHLGLCKGCLDSRAASSDLAVTGQLP